MTAAVLHSPDLVAAQGWCKACYSESGRFVPQVLSSGACMSHLRLLPARRPIAGQLALVDVAPVPRAARPLYVTGLQVDCELCVAAGVPRPRQGMPERTVGDARALCVPCWRREQAVHSPAGRLEAADRAALKILEASLEDTCNACGRTDAGPAGALRSPRAKAGRNAADTDRPCWRCGYEPGGYDWLAEARRVHEREQAEAAHGRQRAEELAEAECEARAQVRFARAALADVEGWRDRLQGVVEDLPTLVKTGHRGTLRVARAGRRRSRPLFVLADGLARHDAARTAAGKPADGRGRPSVMPWVMTVMAVDADVRSGRRSMAGMKRTAWFAGVSETTVTNTWRMAKAIKWSHLTEVGGACSLEQKRATGRSNNRAVQDLRPLHRSRYETYAPFLGVAAALIVQLLERALVLVDEARQDLHAAQEAADRATAAAADAVAELAECTAQDLAWQVEVSDAAVAAAWAEDAARAAQQARLLRGRATVAYGSAGAQASDVVAARRALRAADDHAWKAVHNAAEQAERMSHFCDPPGGFIGSSSSSCSYLGLTFSPRKMITAINGPRRPDGRGEGQHHKGASRSSTKSSASLPVSRPRTLEGLCALRQTKRRATSWSWWANPLARVLMKRLPVLRGTEEFPVQTSMVAAVLGSRLSPDWTADEVIELLEQHAGVWSLLQAGEAHSPLAYLCKLLDRALRNHAVRLPACSPVRDQIVREQAERLHRAENMSLATRRPSWEARDAAAAAERVGTGSGRLAARAIAAAASVNSPAVRRTSTANDSGAPSAMTEAPLEIEWPAVTPPGAIGS